MAIESPDKTAERQFPFRTRHSAQAAACQAQVHGLAMLALHRQLSEEKVGNEPVQAALDVLLDGLCRGD